MEYRYCMVRPLFVDIEGELIRRGVNADYSSLETGRNIYRIPVSEISKLPYDTDKMEHYLGDDDQGYAIYPDAAMEEYRIEQGGSEWKPVKPSS